MRRVDDASIREELDSFIAYCRRLGPVPVRQARIAIEAFMFTHGSNHVSELAPAQRLQLLVFCDHLKTLIGR